MTSDELEQAIVALVSSGRVKIPPYPAVALRIERLLRDGDLGLEALGELVASDPLLAADVLRRASSVADSPGAPVSSVVAAVACIGVREASRLALASGLAGYASAPGPLASLRRRVWADALAAATLCLALAPGRQLSPDVAFAAGLLHDFGKVIALASIEDLVARREDVGRLPAEEWSEIVDRLHVELGVVMAARWDLPPLVSDVVTLHHSEDLRSASDPRLVETVVAVDELLGILRARSYLEIADLEATSSLDPAEHALVLRAVESLSRNDGSLDAADARRAPASTAAAPTSIAPAPPAPRRLGPPPPPYAVELSVGGRRQEFRIVGLATTHVMLTGPAAMPENLLLAMEVKSENPVKGFASVKLAWPENGAYTLLVQPYALAGEALERWRELVASTFQAAA